MRVEVTLYANLVRFTSAGTSPKTLVLDLDDGCTVASVLRRLKVPKQVPTTVLISGRHVRPTRRVRDGERLDIFPPMSGG